jgi:hypothetical protein
MFVLAYGKDRSRHTYACTSCGTVAKVEAAVLAQLDKAMLGREKDPHVVAVLEGDTRYQDALAAVERAQAEIDVWRNEINVTEVEVAGWKQGLKAREAKLETARRALRELHGRSGRRSAPRLSPRQALRTCATSMPA